MTRGQVKSSSTDGRVKIDEAIKNSPTFKGMYKKYQMAKERCSENYRKRHNYYDRGIRVERKDFNEFYRDMNESYIKHINKYGKENTTLDRIDNDGNYSKENCRWATWKVQSNNRRVCVSFEYEGIKYNSITEFCEKNGYNPHTINTRINRDGMSLKEAIETPLSPNDDSRNRGIKVTYKGREYKNISALCKEIGIDKNTVFVRMSRGISLEDAVSIPPILNNKDRNMGIPVEYKGKKYKNITTLCEEKGVDRWLVYSRLRVGKTIEEAIDTPINRKTSHSKK